MKYDNSSDREKEKKKERARIYVIVDIFDDYRWLP